MKKIFALTMTLCCLFIFGACDSNATTMNFSTIAENFTEAMYQGDYDEAVSYINPDYSKTLNTDALAEIVAGTEEVYGDFQEITGSKQMDMDTYFNGIGVVNDGSATGADFVFYYVGLRFEEGEMGFYFLFDRDDRSICSVTVCGTEAPVQTEDVEGEDLEGEGEENGTFDEK